MLSKKQQTKRNSRLRDDVSQRFSKADYKKYQDFIKSFEICQVCDINFGDDAPHHTKQGSHKDDRSLINICIDCHRTLHNSGYSTLKKSRMQLLAPIARNWDIYTNSK